jgi:hypothetical protein
VRTARWAALTGRKKAPRYRISDPPLGHASDRRCSPRAGTFRATIPSPTPTRSRAAATANRQVAFVWYLAKDWRSEWGGALFWCPKALYLPPVFNTLVLFNVGPDTSHFVTQVSPYAQASASPSTDGGRDRPPRRNRSGRPRTGSAPAGRQSRSIESVHPPPALYRARGRQARLIWAAATDDVLRRATEAVRLWAEDALADGEKLPKPRSIEARAPIPKWRRRSHRGPRSRSYR